MSDFHTINPATGEAIASHSRTTGSEVEAALDRSQAAFESWRFTIPEKRSAFLRRLADVLEADADVAISNIVTEMGKPLSQARGEVTKCVELCRYYADHAAELVAPIEVDSEAQTSIVRYDPLGPVLGIMPWNFPYWQVFRWGVPTLTAGNTIILKHADNVQGTAVHVAELFARADAPTGLYENLSLANKDIAPVIADRRVRGVSLTGSVRAGRAVAKAAGDAIKPTVLELGGSDPALILPDANLDRDIDAIVNGRFQNTGQTCIATKRYLVHASIAAKFRDGLVAATQKLTVGDPTSEDTDLGPMARADLRDTLAEQLGRCHDDGLTAIVDGGPINGPGNFFAPVVLDGVTPGTTPFREELFGPVASLCVCDDVDTMIAWANDTDYGLSASIWGDPQAGQQLAPRLDFGCVFVNQGVKSDPRFPFGGVKDSGYGRELGGLGVRQFANIKTVWVK